MQKKIIVLAITGMASGIALAQTNVTIYGNIDVGQAWVKSSGGHNSNTGQDAADQKTVGRLDNNSSYIGFKGVEDLGNGLKALFQYESNVAYDTNGGFTGGRDSFVGLTGSFGTIVGGRLTHPLREMGTRVEFMPSTNGIGTVNSVTGSIHGYKTGADERASNAVAYVTPTFGGGFSATVAYINGEQREDTGANDYNARAVQIAAKYANGPLYVGIGYHKAYDWVPASGAAANMGEDAEARVWRIAAVYTAPFGTKFAALYDDTKADNTGIGLDAKRKAWSIGASHPFGNHTAALQYARSSNTDISGAGDLDDKASIWTALYTYSLSKRTTLHARYSRLENDDEGNFSFYNNSVNNGVAASAANGTYDGATHSGFMVGLRHTF